MPQFFRGALKRLSTSNPLRYEGFESAQPVWALKILLRQEMGFATLKSPRSMSRRGGKSIVQGPHFQTGSAHNSPHLAEKLSRHRSGILRPHFGASALSSARVQYSCRARRC